MSTTDKTRQQLVDTMRKTRAGAAGKTTAARKPPQPAKRTAKSAKKTAATVAKKRATDVTGASRAGTRDSYQVGRRVWPD